MQRYNILRTKEKQAEIMDCVVIKEHLSEKFRTMANFIGKNTDFTWFSGVVEDRYDSLCSRLRVRCLGFHTDNRVNYLPTCHGQFVSWVMGHRNFEARAFSVFLVEGSWVWGYFRDSTTQRPSSLVLRQPVSLGNPNSGFYDPIDEVMTRLEEYNQSVYPKSQQVDTNRLVNDSEKNM